MSLLGNRIKVARHENGYTQTKLAELMKVSVATINRWENNKTAPSSEDLIKLAKFLDVDFMSENTEVMQEEILDSKEMQLEEIRLELAMAKAEKKKMIRIMLFSIFAVIIILSLAFLSFILSMQKIDPEQENQPIKIVEYIYEEGGK